MTMLFSMRSLLAGAALVALPCSAYALDGQDLVKKLNSAYGKGATITPAGVDVSGDTVTLKAVKVTLPGEGPDKTVSLGDIKLSGVNAHDDGSYEIERADFQPINITEDKASISAQDLYMTGITVPAKTDGNDLSSMLFYEKAHVGSASITADGKRVLAIDESTVTAAVEDDGASMSFDAGIKGMKIDLSTVNDPAAKDAMAKLGLETLDGELSTKGSWELQSGTVDIENLTLDFARVGKLNLSLSFSGYTPELIRQLQETAQGMEQNKGNQQAQQAQGMAILGMMQQLSFIGADIRFDDDGFTAKALEYGGSTQGVSGKDMAQMIKAMTPMALAQAKLGELQNSITAAVNAYLDSPKNFTIAAEPEKPVPLPMIFGAAMGAPDTIPKVLGVTVSANE